MTLLFRRKSPYSDSNRCCLFLRASRAWLFFIYIYKPFFSLVCHKACKRGLCGRKKSSWTKERKHSRHTDYIDKSKLWSWIYTGAACLFYFKIKLGKWLLVNQHLFSLIGKLKQASINPVLYCGRLRSQLWRDYYWHETCIRLSVPLVRLTGLDALGTQRNRLFPSNHRSHRPLRHRTWSHVADCRHLPAVRSIPGLFSMAAWLGGALRRARQTTGLVILISATVASSPTFRSKRSWRVTLIAKSQRSLNCWSLDK